MTKIVVSNAAQLASALQVAKGGDSIVLNAGDYGKLSLASASYASQVTITSADPNHQATFTGMSLSKVANLKIDGVNFDYHAAKGASLELSPFSVANSANVAITNSHFHGDNASGVSATTDGFGTGNGLYVVGSTGVTVANNEFEGFHRGMLVSKTNNVTVSGNDIHGMSSDGMDFAQVTNVKIDNNHLHDFVRSPSSLAHPDMIQFWTAGTNTPSTNIAITNNFLDQGHGQETQSIFMNNEAVNGGAGKAMFYSNVLISNNVIRNGDSHGISVGETNGLKIDNNTLLQSVSIEKGGMVSMPSISVAGGSTGVAITDNVVPTTAGSITSPSTGWTVSNNLTASIDNPNSANYIGKLFFDALDTSNAKITDFHAIDGTAISAAHAGAQVNLAASSIPYYGYIENHQTTGSSITSAHQTFDATHIFSSVGKLATTGATAVWDYGDGTTGTGLVTNHVYSGPGNYTATAIVTLANGTNIQVDKTFTVTSSDLLDVNFENGANDQSAAVNAVVLDRATVVNAAGGGHALALNGGTAKYDVDCGFFNNSEYTLTVDFKKNAGQETTGGTLVYFSGAYNISVGADKITANVTTSLGTVALKATGIGIQDADWHRVALAFSNKTGTLNLLVDGHVVASASGLTGAIQGHANGADFYVGNPFGGSFTGQVDNVHLSNQALDTATLSTGVLATAHTDIGTLSHFDAASAFAAATTVAPAAVDLTQIVHSLHPTTSLVPAHDFWIL